MVVGSDAARPTAVVMVVGSDAARQTAVVMAVGSDAARPTAVVMVVGSDATRQTVNWSEFFIRNTVMALFTIVNFFFFCLQSV